MSHLYTPKRIITTFCDMTPCWFVGMLPRFRGQIYVEEGGSRFVLNFNIYLPNYTASHLRRE
jgi:hypothetical protein